MKKNYFAFLFSVVLLIYQILYKESFFLFVFSVFFFISSFYLEHIYENYIKKYIDISLYSFYSKVSLLGFILCIFYLFFCFHYTLDFTLFLLLILCFQSFFLKCFYSLSFCILFLVYKYKYKINSFSSFLEFFSTNKVLFKKKDHYEEKVKIEAIYTPIKKEKKLPSFLKKAIVGVKENQEKKRIRESLNLKKQREVSQYKSGNVSSLLKKANFYFKKGKRLPLKKEDKKEILKRYKEEKQNNKKVIAYLKEEKEETLFLGYIVFSYIKKKEVQEIEKYVCIGTEKTKKEEKYYEEVLLLFKDSTLLKEAFRQKKHYKSVLFFLSINYIFSKVVLLFLFFLSLLGNQVFFSVSSFLFLDFVLLGSLFVFFSIFRGKFSSFKYLYSFFFLILKLIFYYFLYKIFSSLLRISMLQSFFFFTFCLEEGLYYLLFIKLNKRFLQIFLSLILIFFFLSCKLSYFSLSFLSFCFLSFLTLSFLTLLFLLKNGINIKKM